MKKVTVEEEAIINQALVSLEIDLKKLIAREESAIKNLPMDDKSAELSKTLIEVWKKDLVVCLAAQKKLEF